MLAYFGNNNGHGKPHHEKHSNRSCQGIFSHRCLRKASAADPVITRLRGSAGIAGTTEVLQYERGVSHGCSTCFASTPHTCWLNCNSSDTVGLTPQICKG